MKLKDDAKFKRRLTFALKNDIRNLVNFYVSSRKSENLHFDWMLLSKAYKDLDENIQKSYVSCQWSVMQSLKKNWLLVSKMTWRIWWIFTQPLKSPKISLWWAIFVQGIWGLSQKKYREVIFHDTKQWYKVWINLTLWFYKWHEELGTFIKAIKVWKIVHWWALFVKSICFS